MRPRHDGRPGFPDAPPPSLRGAIVANMVNCNMQRWRDVVQPVFKKIPVGPAIED
jgi:hypothetical protein